MTVIELLLQVVSCSAIVWCCICRLALIDKETIPEIRHVVWFLGSVAVLSLGSPIFPWLDPVLFTWEPLSTPHWVYVALVVAFAMLQVSTSRHWRQGLPRCYVRSEFIHDRRQSHANC